MIKIENQMPDTKIAPDDLDAGLTSSTNPLSIIENDMKNLIFLNGKLTSELNESKQKSEADTKDMLLNFIKVADSFEDLFKNIAGKIDVADQQTKIWVNNFRSIYKSLLRTLKALNVIPIEIIIGEKVNPNWHYVSEVVECTDKEHETIIEEMKKGYLWNGKLLRPTEVKATKNII